jgi:CDP-diglyceride synthetase
MQKHIKYSSLISLLFSLIPMYYVYTLPKGNFISGPVTFLLMLIPFFVQIVLFVIIWNLNDSSKRKTMILSIIIFTITILQFYILYRYDNTTS